MGGRSSGPQPLVNLFDFTIAKFKNAAGRQLKPIEAHDIMCKIGEVVVVGGVRRSAMISLSNINDIEMAAAKSGNWWENNTQRALSNNSVAYSRKPDMEQFIAEWKSLYDSKSGERGIYNVAAAQAQAAKYGFDQTFSRELSSLGVAGDVFLPISTSGNSANILAAVEIAIQKGIHIFGLTGYTGGKLAGMCPCIQVPSGSTPRVQEAHILIGHSICGYIDDALYRGR